MSTNDPREMLDRQAAWQRFRRLLPWPVKIRMAEMAREAIKQLRDDSARSKPRNDGVDEEVQKTKRG